MNLIKGFFARSEARRKRSNAIVAMVLGAMCGVFVIITIIGSIIVNIFNTAEANTVRQLYGEEIANACQNILATDLSVDNLPNDAPPYKIVLLRSNTTRRHMWHSELPPQWQADNQDDVDLIGCVEEERLDVEICEYPRVSPEDDARYTIDIDRQQYQVTLTLMNPQTGRLIATQTLQGSDPDPCPADEDVTGSSIYRGDQVELDEFSGWIESYVFGEN